MGITVCALPVSERRRGGILKRMAVRWDRAVGGALVMSGVALVIGGVIGVHQSRFVIEDLSYILSGGIGGLLLLTIGAAILVCADLHDECQELDRLETAIRAVGGAPEAAPPDTRPASQRRQLKIAVGGRSDRA